MSWGLDLPSLTYAREQAEKELEWFFSVTAKLEQQMIEEAAIEAEAELANIA